MKKRDDGPTKPIRAAEVNPKSLETPADQPCLLVLTGVGSGRVFCLDRDITIGRDDHSDIRIVDEWASRLHARLVPNGGKVGIEDLASTNGTLINGEKISAPIELRDGDTISIGSTCVLKFSYHGRLRQEFEEGLYDRASRDGLTGAHSRSFFDEHLRGELSFARRHNRPFAIFMIDIDGLETINQIYDWIAGDSLLIELVHTIQGLLRDDDLCARYEDARFVVLRRLISIDQALSLAGRLRSDFAAEPFALPTASTPLRITISIGVAHFPTHGDSSETLLLAEQALHAAKKAGGNRTITPNQIGVPDRG